MQIKAQFSDAAKTKVVAIFHYPQDSETYPNQDTIQTDDARYIDFAQGTSLPHEPSLNYLKAAALIEVRALRAAFFPILTDMQVEAAVAGQSADAAFMTVLRQQCRDITQVDLSACTTKAQIEGAIKQTWLTMLAGAPASVVAAFKKANT